MQQDRPQLKVTSQGDVTIVELTDRKILDEVNISQIGERLQGLVANLVAELTRGRLTLRLPPPTDETIKVEFRTSDAGFGKVRRVLGIILQRDFGEHGLRNGSPD